MIVFEQGGPALRVGETDLTGRRVAARLFPYVGEVGPEGLRFDPVERAVILRPREGRLEAGPADSEPWRRAIARAPAGPVLLGPSSFAEEVRGAARGAAEGARAAGRAVYLLDPDPAGLPEPPWEPFVALCCGLPDAATLGRIEAAARLLPAGLLLPIIPGWTADEAFLDRALDLVLERGGRFVAPVPLSGDGDSRRRVVEARSRAEPGSEESFFDRVHHGDWARETAKGVLALLDGVARRGLASLPPRPAGAGEPAPNVQAAAALEELAERSPTDEHRFALLRAAARWIDEWGRDLAPVVAEGNFRKIFPFGEEIAREAEGLLRGTS